ncbi:hypothetical protein [Sulfitobacter sp. EE-36]|uniref:hypothetical protein n=1 Tax=Sulfitobacter TaxID=60136 RepID=UPI000066AF4C|nr:hypothetical protein [Sulfitobacter sp. EE-36]EAP83943.1 hypothetical protein EE36_12793 [Sulfitobacter sp. EE-36]
MSDAEKTKEARLKAIRAVERSGMLQSLAKADEVMGAHEATGVGTLKRSYDSNTLSSVAKAVEAARVVSVDPNIGLALKAFTERHALFSQTIQKSIAAQQRPFADLLELHRESASSIAKAMETYRASMPNIQIGSVVAGLNFDRYGSIFKRVSVDRIIGTEFQLASQRLSEQIRSFHEATIPKIDLGLTANIGELLARSLSAQEALLDAQRAFVESQRDAGAASKAEARFHRRMAYFTALISILTFFWMIAHDLEERFEGSNEERADRVELAQMREAFVVMGEQLEELRQVEEERAEGEGAEAAREAAADAELAAIMREIADGLRDAEEPPEGASP